MTTSHKPFRHGVHGYVNRGCRCEVCTTAKSANDKAQYAASKVRLAAKRAAAAQAQLKAAPAAKVDHPPAIPCAHLRGWR